MAVLNEEDGNYYELCDYNGEYYIKYLHRAQITKDIEESYKFETIDLAKEILQAASNVLKDYYVYNLKTQRKCWRIMTEEELEELRARKKLKELNLERLSGKHIHQMLRNCFT